MELESVNAILKQYRDLLSDKEEYNTVLQNLIAKPKQKPILQILPVEAEDDLSYQEEQRQLSEILLDMHAIDDGILELKDTIKNTIASLDDSIERITVSVQKQREQAEDINVICGMQSPYTATIPIYVDNFTDVPAEIIGNKTFGAMPVAINQIAYDIVSIEGNGYPGNAFVYNDYVFENKTEDRSVASYILDHNKVTAYDYSRLSTRSKTEAIGSTINYDDKPVECVLLLHAEEPVCKAILHIDESRVAVEKVEISDDGLNFKTISDEPIYINDIAESYRNCNYIYGTPILCFPYTSFVRITLSCNTATNDQIAIENKNAAGTNLITLYPNTYRKKITIREIELYSAEYKECTIISDEILNDCAIDKISLFASEYIPDHFTETDYLTYSLLINGQEYPIVPANSGKNGIMIIKYSEETLSANSNTALIHETIKSVRVKITLRPFAGTETPHVSNLKLCIGKNTGDLYVESVFR